MKISKKQTALIVVTIAGIIGALILVNIVRIHPIYSILIAVATVGIVVGGIMYKKNV